MADFINEFQLLVTIYRKVITTIHQSISIDYILLVTIYRKVITTMAEEGEVL
jgi:hypothetical protein